MIDSRQAPSEAQDRLVASCHAKSPRYIRLFDGTLCRPRLFFLSSSSSIIPGEGGDLVFAPAAGRCAAGAPVGRSIRMRGFVVELFHSFPLQKEDALSNSAIGDVRPHLGSTWALFGVVVPFVFLMARKVSAVGALPTCFRAEWSRTERPPPPHVVHWQAHRRSVVIRSHPLFPLTGGPPSGPQCMHVAIISSSFLRWALQSAFCSGWSCSNSASGWRGQFSLSGNTSRHGAIPWRAGSS